MKDRLFSRRSFLTISAMTAASIALDWKKISAWAASMGPKENYPTVIIGAGLGGLCSGAYLARQGIPVTVVEQHAVPGGYATAFERQGGRFIFEVSLHGLSAKNNAVERMLKNLGVYDQLDFVPLPEIYCLKTPKGDILVPQRDPETYIKNVAALYPDEEAGIRGFVNEMIGIAEEADLIHERNGRFFKPIFPLQYRKMWNVRNKTLADLLNDYVNDPSLKNALSGLWGYYGLPPSKLSAFYYAVATGGYLKNGSYYIKQRSQNLSSLLAKTIEDAGGKIIYGRQVKKILVEQNAVSGIELDNGSQLAAKAVVSNASAVTTFERMLPAGALPEGYLEKIRSYKPSISSFIVWLGLNKEIKNRVPCYGIHVPSGSGVEKGYEACITGDIEHGPFGVAVYDKAFDGYSAPGASTVMLIFLSGYGPWKKFEDDYKSGNKTAYNLEKERWADILVRRAQEQVIPDLSSMIEVREAATPLTNWRFTGNTEGAIYGFEQSMDNAYMNRISNDTPINGLYLASAWGNPGGGYEGVLRSGEKTFQLLMESWGG